LKVADLKILLARYPDDFDVILSTDGEGNIFSPLGDVVGGLYEAESTWAGEFYHEDVVDPEYSNNAVCLWPTN
jgi:hypothetical protein